MLDVFEDMLYVTSYHAGNRTLFKMNKFAKAIDGQNILYLAKNMRYTSDIVMVQQSKQQSYCKCVRHIRSRLPT